VLGNLIGTQKDGKSALGNAVAGVEIADSSAILVGNNVLGMANTIAFNGGDGVEVFPENPLTILTLNNGIFNNSIFSNGDLGIDLVGEVENTAGATKNDPGDADTGANQLQNKPVISSATTSSDGIIIKGKLNSTPNQNFTVQFVSSPSGNEGRKFISQMLVSTDSNGNSPLSVSFDIAVSAGRRMTATATNSVGNTSEVSAPRTVVAQ